MSKIHGIFYFFSFRSPFFVIDTNFNNSIWVCCFVGIFFSNFVPPAYNSITHITIICTVEPSAYNARTIQIIDMKGKLQVQETGAPKNLSRKSSLMHMRQIHTFFNQAKTWQLIVCLILFPSFLTEFTCFVPKIVLFFMIRTIFDAKHVNSGKNGEKHKSKQTISCHVLT